MTDTNLPVSEKSRTVHLLDMSGHEFEKLCRIIFSDLGYGTIEHTPLTGDMGKDLIIHSAQGKILVECKHHPDSSIGRPDIQKLHSALISERAVKGIFVTTGSYSRLAVEHAKSLSPPIELVDRHLLLDLASRAGIRLVTESGRERIYTYRIADDRTLLEKISARLDSYLVSRPRRSYEMLVLKQRQINLRPIYWVEYDVDAEFSTTVGVIHTERASGRVFVDGNEGAVMIDELGRFVSGIPTQAVVPFDEISKELSGVSNPQFKMSLSDIKEIAFQHIVARHTKQVSYSGRNNQIYNKLCEPGRNDIFINDVSQIYLPENSIIFSLLGRIHTMAFADCGKADIHVYQDDTSRCQLCGQTLKNGGFICNNCGAIACKRKSLFKSKLHGFVCEQCGTTVCANCAYWIRKMLFFKSILCPKCSQRMVEQGKRSIKLK